MSIILENKVEINHIVAKSIINTLYILVKANNGSVATYIDKLVLYKNTFLLENLILLDNNLKNNKLYYFHLDLENSFTGYKSIDFIFISILYKNKLITNNDELELYNKLVNSIDKIKNCIDNSMQINISIDYIIEDVQKVINISQLSMKNLLKSSLLELEQLKRENIKDFDYTRMFNENYSFQRPIELVEFIEQNFDDNLYIIIMHFFYVDIKKILNDMIKNYGENALFKFASISSIDDDNYLETNYTTLSDENIINDYYHNYFINKFNPNIDIFDVI